MYLHKARRKWYIQQKCCSFVPKRQFLKLHQTKMIKLFILLCSGVLTNSNFIIASTLKGVDTSNNSQLIEKNTTAAVSSKPSVSQIATTSRPATSGFKLPCSCAEGQCGCCSGPILDQFNQRACLNFTYEPDEFALTTTMSMNRRVLFKRTVSGKNPPPMCVRLPRFDFIRFCVELSNIYFASRNVHLCIDMEANWQDITLVEWSFDCIRMGASGVAVVGPEDGGGLPGNPIDAVDQTDEDYDDSARNAPPPSHQNGSLILDKSLQSFDKTSFNKEFVNVQKLPNGNVKISYKNKNN